MTSSIKTLSPKRNVGIVLEIAPDSYTNDIKSVIGGRWMRIT